MVKRKMKKYNGQLFGLRAAALAAALMSTAALSACSIGANAQGGSGAKPQTLAAETEAETATEEGQTPAAAGMTTETALKDPASLYAMTAAGPGAALETEVAPEDPAAAPSFEERDETVYVQANDVNVRTSPEIKDGTAAEGGNLAFVAMRGQAFHRTAYSDGFSRLEKDGKSYYIASSYLSVTPPEKEEAESAAPAASETGNADNAQADGASAGYEDGQEIGLDSSWKYADFAEIKSGKAVLYKASANRKNKIIAVNAGHGTKGGTSVKTYCHPDKTPKVTGGTTSAGATKAVAVSSGMNFLDGTPEKNVTLRMAQIFKEKLLSAGYDVLMLRDGEDVQLDNVARSVIANNTADCHIALHWDGDGLSTIKGCFYMSVPDKLKQMEPVASHWQEHERLGDSLIAGLKAQGMKIWGSNPLDMDLTQTSFSTVPSVDIELGNQASRHDDDILRQQADGLVAGVNAFFGY